MAVLTAGGIVASQPRQQQKAWSPFLFTGLG
jgi:hypothetical protein